MPIGIKGFQKGMITWNKGKTLSDEHKQKVSIALKGKTPKNFKSFILGKRKGKKFTKETLEQMRISHLGQVAWNKGKEMPIETRAKISKSRKGKNSGKDHYNYKNGKYTIENMKNYHHYNQIFEYKEWRKSVFKRDDYQCQKCFNKKGQYITAHHIKSWAKYPELRYKINNGLTLCEKCHSRTDNYKGRGKGKI